MVPGPAQLVSRFQLINKFRSSQKKLVSLSAIIFNKPIKLVHAAFWTSKPLYRAQPLLKPRAFTSKYLRLLFIILVKNILLTELNLLNYSTSFLLFFLTCLLKLVYNWTSFRTFATKPIAVVTSKPNTFLEPTSVGNALTSLERRTLSGNTNWCGTKTRSNSGLTFSCETNLTKYRKTWKTNQTWINCESWK
jgi:hypothetical protein